MSIDANLAEVSENQPVDIKTLVNSIRLAYVNGVPATRGSLDNQINAVFNDPNIPEMYRDMYENIAMVFNVYRNIRRAQEQNENQVKVDIDYWEGLRLIIAVRDHVSRIRKLAKQILVEEEEIASALVGYAKYFEDLIKSISLVNIPFSGEVNVDKLANIRLLPYQSLERIHFPVGWLSLVMSRLAIENPDNTLPRLAELNISGVAEVSTEKIDFVDDVIRIFCIGRASVGEFIPDPEIEAHLRIVKAMDEVARMLINFNEEDENGITDIRRAVFEFVDTLDAIVPPDWEHHMGRLIDRIEERKGLWGLKLDTRNRTLEQSVKEQLQYVRRGIEDSVKKLGKLEFKPENIRDIIIVFREVVRATKYHLRLPGAYLFFAEEALNVLMQPEP